jgi:hypothetical protein
MHFGTRSPSLPAGRTRGPLLRTAVDRLLLATTAVNFALGAVWVVLFGALVASGATRGADYTAFYTGWQLLLQGHGSQLYDPLAQAAMQRQVLGGMTFVDGLAPFTNPPHLVLPFVPLGLLPLNISFLVWTVIQVGFLAAALGLVLRGPARDWRPAERLAMCGWLVGSPCLAIAFFQGSFSLLVVLGVTAAFVALESGRDRIAGVALALASVKPQGMIGPAVAVLVGRRWQAVAAGLAVGASLAVAATAAFGPGVWMSYIDFLGQYTASFDRYSVDPAVMWNVRGTLTLLLGRGNAGLINAASFAAFAAGAAAVGLLWSSGWRRATRADAGSNSARFGLTIVITVLTSPHLNPHDDLLLVVAAIAAYAAWRKSPRAPLLALALGIAPAAILFTNGLSAGAPTTLPIRVPTLLALALGVVLAIAVRERRGMGTTDPRVPAGVAGFDRVPVD